MNPFITQIKKEASSILQKGDTMFLYGSRARGDNHVYSDWDLLILTRDMDENDAFEKYIYPLVLFGQKNNQEISVITYSQKEWEDRKATPFYQNIKNDKIQLF